MNLVNKKGFTLIELLIATTIFATVMVMALVTFSWAANYNSILREIRVTSGDGKYIMAEIVKDVRLANGYRTLVGEQRGEISLVSCTGWHESANCNRFIDYSATTHEINDNPDEYHATCDGDQCWNGILILQGEKMVAYYTLRSALDSDNYIFRRATGTRANNLSAVTINDENATSVKVDFYGKLAKKEARTYQPYLIVEVNSKSKNYDSLPHSSRYKFQLETLIETRDYN